MPSNILLSSGTASSINLQVEKILRDLGDPPPPLRLEDVRELLRLDLGYYSSTDSGWLQEKIHQLRVAGKQILARPTLLLDVVQKIGLKGLLIPDRRRILVDGDLPAPKQRWSEAHEMIHDVLPWHIGAALGDPDHTLSLACEAQIEAEANYGAGRLLFLGNRFEDEVRAAPLDFSRVRKLSELFGNSLTTTLWRCIEHASEPAIGLVSLHPGRVIMPMSDPVRYFIRSPRLAAEFSGITGDKVFQLAQQYCRSGRGPLGEAEIPLRTDSGEDFVFHFETFFNHHDALTLGRCLGR